jgi:hypothetical protein
MRNRKSAAVGFAVASTMFALSAGYAGAQAIYPGPAYQGGTVGGVGGIGGYNSQSIQTNPGVNLVSIGGVGTEIGRGSLYYPNPNPALAPTTDSGGNGFFFTSAGYMALGAVGNYPDGDPNNTNQYSINHSGLVSGTISDSTFTHLIATVWNATGAPTELNALGASADGTHTSSTAYVINDSGVAAGSSAIYGGGAGNTSLGGRPVMWAASSIIPTALAMYDTGQNYNFGSPINGYNVGSVQSINSSGYMAGVDEKYVSSGGAGTGADIGVFASVWDPSGATITQLADLPGNGTYDGLPAGDNVNATTVYTSYSRVINNAGMIAGTISKYDPTQYAASGHGSQGTRPVRWLSSSSTPQLLDGVGTTTSSGVTGYTSGSVYGMNDQGDIVGNINNYNGSGTSLGTLPELWKASNGTAVTPLSLLGTSSTGTSSGTAYGVNDGDWSVGNINDYSTNGGDIYGTPSGTSVAALWDPNGDITDLNVLFSGSLVSASGTTAGWVLLTNAYGITGDGWISGKGTYNPGGGYPTYTRDFLIDDPTAVPEPASIATLAVLTSIVGLRRRRTSPAVA